MVNLVLAIVSSSLITVLMRISEKYRKNHLSMLAMNYLMCSVLGAVMTGSGSAVLALFETRELCEWAKSRYKGKFRTYVVQTVIPDYTACGKKVASGWRNPFALSEEEMEAASEE